MASGSWPSRTTRPPSTTAPTPPAPTPQESTCAMRIVGTENPPRYLTCNASHRSPDALRGHAVGKGLPEYGIAFLLSKILIESLTRFGLLLIFGATTS